MEKWLKKNKVLVFSLGLAAIFLANSMVALIEPDEFREVIEGNVLTSSFGHADLLVAIIAINDGLLAAFILSGKFKRAVSAWAVVWLSGVIFMTGFWTPDVVEHLAVVALVAYYSQLDVGRRSKKR